MLFNFDEIGDSIKEFVSDNATTLLTAGGVVGVVGTALLSGRAGFKASEILREAEVSKLVKAEGPLNEKEMEVVVHLDTLEKIKLVGLQFAPPIITGGFTIAAIVMSHKMSANKAAVLAAAYGLTQKQFDEYRTKVQEKLTGPKAQAIDEELAQDRVNNSHGSNTLVIVDGEVLCFDEPTGRYFKSSMEDIRRAVNTVNELILHENGASASMFYELLGMPPTTWSEEVGFNMNNLCDLSFNYVKEREGDRPCLSINFRNMPIYEYHRLY